MDEGCSLKIYDFVCVQVQKYSPPRTVFYLQVLFGMLGSHKRVCFSDAASETTSCRNLCLPPGFSKLSLEMRGMSHLCVMRHTSARLAFDGGELTEVSKGFNVAFQVQYDALVLFSVFRTCCNS